MSDSNPKNPLDSSASQSRVRLDKLLSNLGYCTRKEVRTLIKEDLLESSPGVLAEKTDERVIPSQVRLSGEPLDHPDGIVAIFNKPLGCVCTHSTKEGSTIYDHLPSQWKMRDPQVVSVGRLDRDTTGLILITDQHRWVHDLTSPRKKVRKIYEFEVDGRLDPAMIPEFAKGFLLIDDPEPTLPGKLEILGSNSGRLTIVEGRFHQVKRMMEKFGLNVTKLHRTHFGSLSLGDLPEGELIFLEHWDQTLQNSYETE